MNTSGSFQRPSRLERGHGLYGRSPAREAILSRSESGQPYGTRAKHVLSEMVFGKEVRIVSQDVDRYGRTVGRVFEGSRHVNAEMVRQGAAWVYRQYNRDPLLLKVEAEARSAGRAPSRRAERRGGRWVGVESESESMAATTVMAQLVVRSMRSRHPAIRAISARWKWANTVMNSFEVPGKTGASSVGTKLSLEVSRALRIAGSRPSSGSTKPNLLAPHADANGGTRRASLVRV